MDTGVVFDIKEFSVFDGPGIRTTVFLKGCPLRCQWCHNPEGLARAPQLLTGAGCRACGACQAACQQDVCTACGACVLVCPGRLRRVCGQEWDARALAARLMKDAPELIAAGGGMTFSGGEPLAQWDFVRAVMARLEGVHTAVETSGYAPPDAFAQMMARADLVMMDIKLMDPAAHRRYTGVDNAPILRNARALCAGETPFIVRVPLIPGVNDGAEHAQAVAALVEGAKSLVRVELLPYHRSAGAKYAMVGMAYAPEFDTQREPMAALAPFTRRGIDVRVL